MSPVRFIPAVDKRLLWVEREKSLFTMSEHNKYIYKLDKLETKTRKLKNRRRKNKNKQKQKKQKK